MTSRRSVRSRLEALEASLPGDVPLTMPNGQVVRVSVVDALDLFHELLSAWYKEREPDADPRLLGAFRDGTLPGDEGLIFGLIQSCARGEGWPPAEAAS